MMREHDLIGRCGIYCGACIVYRSEHDQGKLLDMFCEHAHCEKEKVTCQGCSGLTESCWGNHCKIVACLDQKGYQYCYECENFIHHTCDKRASLQTLYSNVNVDLDQNMRTIQQGEIDVWLKESEETYTCPHCGKPTTYFLGYCHHCGETPHTH